MSNESTAVESVKQDGRTLNALRLDDLSLDKNVVGYPEELKDPVKWLGCYIREECHRDMDAFMARLKDLRIEHDKTTWSRVLRGRWNRDNDGNALPSPVLALSKL